MSTLEMGVVRLEDLDFAERNVNLHAQDWADIMDLVWEADRQRLESLDSKCIFHEREIDDIRLLRDRLEEKRLEVGLAIGKGECVSIPIMPHEHRQLEAILSSNFPLNSESELDLMEAERILVNYASSYSFQSRFIERIRRQEERAK